MKQNHYDEAAAILKKIVEEINPDDKIDYYELAYAYCGKCDYDKAVTVLKKVVNEIDGSDKTAHEKLADTYNEAGKYAEAVRSYQQAIVINNTDKTTHEKLGDAYLGMYNSVAGAFDWAKDRAIDSYREVIELDSADKGVGNKLAALQNQEEQNVIEFDSEGDALDEPEDVASDVEKTSTEQPDWEIPAFLRVNRKKPASPDEATSEKYQPTDDALDEPEDVASERAEVLDGIDRLRYALRQTDLETSELDRLRYALRQTDSDTLNKRQRVEVLDGIDRLIDALRYTDSDTLNKRQRVEVLGEMDGLIDALGLIDLETPTSPVLDAKDSTSSNSDTLKKRQKAEKLSEKPAHPENMVLIPAGDFSMGGGYYPEEKPSHIVHVDAFYMDIHEVTNAQYKEFVDANPEWQKSGVEAQFHDGNYLEYWDKNNDYPRDKGNHPVNCVSWYAAMAYAEWTGKRLPTEAEWEKAARGGLRGKRYPWGHSLDKSKANYSTHATTPVGSYPANGYGLYDMAGNVNEWCLDEFQRDFYSKSPRQNPIAGAENIVDVTNGFLKIKKRRVVRGGDSSTSSISYSFALPRLTVTSRYRYSPDYTYSVGFRCVYVPPAHSDAVGK